jgi:hypothetical protein
MAYIVILQTGLFQTLRNSLRQSRSTLAQDFWDHDAKRCIHILGGAVGSRFFIRTPGLDRTDESITEI